MNSEIGMRPSTSSGETKSEKEQKAEALEYGFRRLDCGIKFTSYFAVHLKDESTHSTQSTQQTQSTSQRIQPSQLNKPNQPVNQSTQSTFFNAPPRPPPGKYDKPWSSTHAGERRRKAESCRPGRKLRANRRRFF